MDAGAMAGIQRSKGNAVRDNDEMTEKFKVIDAEIARKAASLQVDGYTVRGYFPGEGDFDLITQTLVDLVASYYKPDAVVRNSSGQYVARSALK
ncbi:hypothetical protein JMJ35_003513 [Cladonia borealis]|uniref:Uncharacterized protein n=1 Tax=Cladonia borealis TaxID=184061 RepID=A0AA39UBU7_9LECA|nr:hypothetical protein JMJ35_003513 [Cladonia borealis]